MKNLLFRYLQFNFWANSRIVEFLQSLPEEELDVEIVSSFTSIRKTIYHIWDAESLWLSRLNGDSPFTWPSQGFSGKFIDAAAEIRSTSQKLIDYAEEADIDTLDSLIDYKNVKGDAFKGLVADILQHVVNHGSYHRGQIITMLRQTGHTNLFSTDYIGYCRETVMQ
jgi:uncharacterized damage-inducible protein DinB